LVEAHFHEGGFYPAGAEISAYQPDLKRGSGLMPR
jgi:hypothetical protein